MRRHNCHHCGEPGTKTTSAYNRAKKLGLNLYCGRTCAGIGRRSKATTAEKVVSKSEYDRVYREKNRTRILATKKKHYDANQPEIRRRFMLKMQDPAFAAKTKEATRKSQARAEYLAAKVEYDKIYRAKKHYGPFWESALLTRQICSEVKRMVPNPTDLSVAKGTLNKRQARKIQWKRQTSTQ